MTRTRIITGAICLMAFAYLGTAAYAIAEQSIEELILCTDTGGLKIPFSRELCRKYLFALRGSARDIDALQRGTGASFVVHGTSSPSDRERVLRFLIGKGLDVNRQDMHRLTPLHSAVIGNSNVELDLLLRNGADPRLKDDTFGLTPLELALKLKAERPEPDRQAVITALRAAR